MALEHVVALTTGEPEQWQAALEETGVYDFYHLSSFHHLAETRGEGTAVMPVFREQGYTIAFPMLLRSIDLPAELHPGGGFRDASCVFGFVGPVASARELPDGVRQVFLQELQEFLEHERILTVYSRINPIVGDVSLLQGYGEVVEAGVTLSIDLTLPPEKQIKQYRRNHRQDIERLRKNGFHCQKVGIEHLDDLTRIYSGTMNRVSASSTYRFDRPYFKYLMQEMPDTMHLWVCKERDTVAAVVLCASCNHLIEAYLAGTAEEYLKHAPMKLLFDAIRNWGCETGAAVMHLGGGVGGKRDSLYDFKLGFGSREHVYYSWRHVVNQAVYDEVCRNVNKHAEIEGNDFYFPIYRSPNMRLHPGISEPQDA